MVEVVLELWLVYVFSIISMLVIFTQPVCTGNSVS